MKRWFLLSAIGSDRPGLVAELAQLIYDCDANLEDSRMTILGTDFAVILLCSSPAADAADRIAVGAKRLERDHGLTILLRSLEGELRPQVPAPGTKLYRLEAVGEDRAGIVAADDHLHGVAARMNGAGESGMKVRASKRRVRVAQTVPGPVLLGA